MKQNSFTVSLIITVVSVILIGVFCTSSAKGAAALANRHIQTEPPPDTVQTEPEDTDTPIVTDSENTSDITLDISDNSSTEPVTAPPETEPVITDPEKEVFVKYNGRTFGENETLIGKVSTGEADIVISRVKDGDINYFICDIKVRSAKYLRTAFADGLITSREYTSYTAKQVGATFAVNGDFCGFRNNGIIIRNGKLYRNKPADWDLCYLNKYGDLKVGLNNDFDGNKLVSDGVLQSWCFGPTVVSDYKAVEEFNSPGLSRTHNEPRTAIGQVDTLHYIILVVDAVRTSVTTGGMSFKQLADTFVGLGCKTAYNLDGGGSTTLYYLGQVINTPCINGERSISDIVFIK